MKKYTLEYYYFFDLVEEVEKKLGYDQREVHEHLGGEYKDFWHWQIDSCFSPNMCNDSHTSLYVGLDFECEKYAPNEWQRDIQKVYHDLFYHLSDEGYLNVYISW